MTPVEELQSCLCAAQTDENGCRKPLPSVRASMAALVLGCATISVDVGDLGPLEISNTCDNPVGTTICNEDPIQVEVTNQIQKIKYCNEITDTQWIKVCKFDEDDNEILLSDTDTGFACGELAPEIVVQESCNSKTETIWVQDVVYTTEDGVTTPVPLGDPRDTGKPCVEETERCTKTQFHYSMVENSGMSFKDDYTVDFLNSDGTTTTLALPTGTNYATQILAWEAVFAAAYPDVCYAEARWNVRNGSIGALDSSEISWAAPGFGRLLEIKACPGAVIPIGGTVTKSSNPKMVGFTVVTDTAVGELLYDYDCVACGDNGITSNCDCSIPCGEDFPEVPAPVCTFTTETGCDIQLIDDDGITPLDPPIATPITAVYTICGADISVSYYEEDADGNLEDYNNDNGTLGYFGDCDTLEPIEPPVPECPEGATWNEVEVGGHYFIMDNSTWTGTPGAHITNGFNFEFTFHHEDGSTSIIQQTADPLFNNIIQQAPIQLGCSVKAVCANHTSPKGCHPIHVANLAGYPAYDAPTAPGDIQNNLGNPVQDELWASGWLFDCDDCVSKVVKVEITNANDAAYIGAFKDVIAYDKPKTKLFQAVTCDGVFYKDCDGNDVAAPNCCPSAPNPLDEFAEECGGEEGSCDYIATFKTSGLTSILTDKGEALSGTHDFAGGALAPPESSLNTPLMTAAAADIQAFLDANGGGTVLLEYLSTSVLTITITGSSCVLVSADDDSNPGPHAFTESNCIEGTEGGKALRTTVCGAVEVDLDKYETECEIATDGCGETTYCTSFRVSTTNTSQDNVVEYPDGSTETIPTGEMVNFLLAQGFTETGPAIYTNCIAEEDTFFFQPAADGSSVNNGLPTSSDTFPYQWIAVSDVRGTVTSVEEGAPCETAPALKTSGCLDAAILDALEDLKPAPCSTAIAVDLFTMTGISGDLRNREWDYGPRVINNATIAYGSAIRTAFDFTLPTTVDASWADLTVNDTNSDADVSDVQVIEGFIIVDTAVDVRWSGASLGYLAVELGECCGDYELKLEAASGDGNLNPSAAVTLPAGVHAIRIWNIDDFVNSSRTVEHSLDGGATWIAGSPAIGYSGTKPTEECVKAYKCLDTKELFDVITDEPIDAADVYGCSKLCEADWTCPEEAEVEACPELIIGDTTNTADGSVLTLPIDNVPEGGVLNFTTPLTMDCEANACLADNPDALITIRITTDHEALAYDNHRAFIWIASAGVFTAVSATNTQAPTASGTGAQQIGYAAGDSANGPRAVRWTELTVSVADLCAGITISAGGFGGFGGATEFLYTNDIEIVSGLDAICEGCA